MAASARISIRLTPTLDALMVDRARQGQRVSDIVREALEAYLGAGRAPCQTDRPTPRGVSDGLSDELSAIWARLTAVEQQVASLVTGTSEPAASCLGEKIAPGAVSDLSSDRSSDSSVPTYDPTRYRLGRLCPQRHEYQGTGQTLRYGPKRRCLQCESVRKRAKRRDVHG